jgi:hypothetical protein
MTCLLLLAAGMGFSAADEENVVYTRDRAFRIPLELSEAERKDAAWIRLMVSTDAGKTWNRVREESPKRPTVTFRAPGDGQYWLALAVIGHDQKMHPADPAELQPGLRVVVDSAKPEVSLEAVKTKSGLRGVRWTTKDGSPENKMVLKCAVWDENVKAWKPRSLDEARNSTIWFGRNEVIAKMQLQVADIAGNEAVEQIDIDGDRFLSCSQEKFALSPAAPTPGQFAENTKKRSESRTLAEIEQASHRAAEESLTPLQRQASETKNALAEASPLPTTKSTTTTVAKPNESVQQVSAKDETAMIKNAVSEEIAKPNSAAKPANKMSDEPEVDVTYSNRRTTVLHYEMSNIPKGEAVELWGHKGKVWICLGRDEDGASPMEALFPDDGRWGVSLVVGDASGSGRPAPEDPAAMWVEIDTKMPKVEIQSACFESNQVRLTWKAVDANMVDDSVRILYARDAQGPWETIAVQQKSSGEYLWKASAHATDKPIYFRIDATDRAGNIGSATTAKPISKGASAAETAGVGTPAAKPAKKSAGVIEVKEE